MKNTWQGYAVAALTSFFLGGGGAMVYSNAQVDELRVELQAEITKLETKLEAEQAQDIATDLRIIEALARVEEQVKYIRERLDDG